MPLSAPIGSNRGFQTRKPVRLMVGKLEVSVMVDAGIGHPSEAMELGTAAVLVDSAVATAGDPAATAHPSICWSRW